MNGYQNRMDTSLFSEARRDQPRAAWRTVAAAYRGTTAHSPAPACPGGIPCPHRSSRQPVMAALISLPTPQVTAPITIDQALVRCFPVAATRWLSSHRSAGNLEPNHRDRRCLR